MGIGLKVPERKIRWAIRQMQLVIAKLLLNFRPKMLMHCHKPQITSIQHILFENRLFGSMMALNWNF